MCIKKGLNKREILLIFMVILMFGSLMLVPVMSSIMQTFTIHSSGTVVFGPIVTLPLHAEGRYIKDSNGNIVYLRGIHHHAFLSPPYCGEWIPEGGTRNQAWDGVWDPQRVIYNLDKMQEFGFTALRMFMPPCILWRDNTYDVRDRVETVISLANERGIYVILVFYTVGASAGQTAIPWDPYTKTNERGIFTSSQDYINFMLQFTAYYKDYPNVIYEFWNEPHGNAQHLEYFNVCQSLLTQIRATGNEHLILYQFGYSGYESNTEIANGRILDGSNVVYTSHLYRNLVGGPTSYWGVTGEHDYDGVRNVVLNKARMQNVIDANLTTGIFEAGCNVRVEPHADEVEAFANMLKVCNEEGFSYTPLQWFDDAHAFGIFEDSFTYPWLPPLNDGGQALKAAIEEGYQ